VCRGEQSSRTRPHRWPPERRAKLAGLTGKAQVHADLHGTRDDVAGEVKVELADVHKDDKGPLGATVSGTRP